VELILGIWAKFAQIAIAIFGLILINIH